MIAGLVVAMVMESVCPEGAELPAIDHDYYDCEAMASAAEVYIVAMSHSLVSPVHRSGFAALWQDQDGQWHAAAHGISRDFDAGTDHHRIATMTSSRQLSPELLEEVGPLLDRLSADFSADMFAPVADTALYPEETVCLDGTLIDLYVDSGTRQLAAKRHSCHEGTLMEAAETRILDAIMETLPEQRPYWRAAEPGAN